MSDKRFKGPPCGVCLIVESHDKIFDFPAPVGCGLIEENMSAAPTALPTVDSDPALPGWADV
jgi:hypothetical protein